MRAQVGFGLITALLASLAINACSTSQKKPGLEITPIQGRSATEDRHPSNESVPTDLGEAVRQFRRFVNGPDFSARTCGSRLSSLYTELFNLPATHFDQAKLRNDALNVVDDLWQTRLELRRKFSQMALQGQVTHECEVAVRRAFLVSRFIEEYVAEWKLQPAPPDPDHLLHPWSGDPPYIMKAPGLDQIEFKSGDILLSRGDAFTSAAIARVGDVEGQFSHLALVYVDEQTKKAWTIEAYIELGVIVAPIEKYLSRGNVRSALFRYPDAKLAHQAAKIMFERASKAIAEGGNIPYDFHFDSSDTSQVFCGEVAVIGYQEASGGKLVLPLFSSQITRKHREFLSDIGFDMTSTFAPVDMEVDPRFELLAEWRDLARTHQSHIKDAVLTKMFDWMENFHYVLDKSLWNKITGNVLWTVRRWPLFGDLLKERFPENMPVTMIEASRSLGEVGETLFDAVADRDQEYHRSTGLWMTPKQMQDALEQIRIEDFGAWERWTSWQRRNEFVSPRERDPIPMERILFHNLFYPVERR